MLSFSLTDNFIRVFFFFCGWCFLWSAVFFCMYFALLCFSAVWHVFYIALMKLIWIFFFHSFLFFGWFFSLFLWKQIFFLYFSFNPWNSTHKIQSVLYSLLDISRPVSIVSFAFSFVMFVLCSSVCFECVTKCFKSIGFVERKEKKKKTETLT